MKSNCFLLLIVILLVYYLVRGKESYKKTRRQNIKSAWKRKGKSGQTVAKTGTRWPQYPRAGDVRFIFNTTDVEDAVTAFNVSDLEDEIPTLEDMQNSLRQTNL